MGLCTTEKAPARPHTELLTISRYHRRWSEGPLTPTTNVSGYFIPESFLSFFFQPTFYLAAPQTEIHSHLLLFSLSLQTSLKDNVCKVFYSNGAVKDELQIQTPQRAAAIIIMSNANLTCLNVLTLPITRHHHWHCHLFIKTRLFDTVTFHFQKKKSAKNSHWRASFCLFLLSLLKKPTVSSLKEPFFFFF